ncbi:hypothetical protein Tco_0386975 [Tanacetum coccineum]
MAPKRATRSTPVTENPTTTTVTNAQLQAMIDQGVTAALTARDANRNGDDSHTSGTGAQGRIEPFSRMHYQDFMECNLCISKALTENKRKLDNNNQAQQQLPKRQNVAQVSAGTGERKESVMSDSENGDPYTTGTTSPIICLAQREPERHHLTDYAVQLLGLTPEADPEEDDDVDTEEDPIDYLLTDGDDGDDEMDIEEDVDADMDIDEDVRWDDDGGGGGALSSLPTL